MKQKDYLVIDRNILQQFKAMQAKKNYLSKATLRFWLNDDITVYDTHWHLDLEIITPLENDYTVMVGTETFELSPGDILIIPPGASHSMIPTQKGLRLIYVVELSLLSNLQGYSILSSLLSQPTVINQSTCPEIYETQIGLILQLLRDYCAEDGLWEFTLYPNVIRFFTNYAHYLLKQENPSAPNSSLADNQHMPIDQLNQVLSYMDTHFAEDMTLEQAADVAGFSKYHFSRLFKQYTGQNFYEYLCFRRIKSAQVLLSNPSLSITEVALRSGFGSLSTFNRIFKKITSCTPSHYRQLYNSPFLGHTTPLPAIEDKPDQTDSQEEK